MSTEFHGIHGIQWILEPGGTMVSRLSSKEG